jgi:hypothetical protein
MDVVSAFNRVIYERNAEGIPSASQHQQQQQQQQLLQPGLSAAHLPALSTHSSGRKK